MPDTLQPSASQTYVLDTSVLLADPGALRRFAEHEVVLYIQRRKNLIIFSHRDFTEHFPNGQNIFV